MEAACYNVHDRLSPRLYNIGVLDDGRSGGLTSSQEARRRISQQTWIRLLETQKKKSKRVSPISEDCASMGHGGRVG